MTSIEWLIEQTRKPEWHSLKRGEIFGIAKEMHKQEIIKSFEYGVSEGVLTDINYLKCNEEAEQYYQETFVSKGSDEVELPQQEISDEEIEKAAWEYVYNHKINGHNIVHWINAIKWYREQLKSK